MKRCEKFVLEAQKGITFEVSDGANGEIIIRALRIESSNVQSENYANPPIPTENYANPPIPKGYNYIWGEWNNGFVIEKVSVSDWRQLVWIPVGSLDSNRPLNEKQFSKKVGKGNYQYGGLNDKANDALCKQIKSIKKYGGFYIPIREDDACDEPDPLVGLHTMLYFK